MESCQSADNPPRYAPVVAGEGNITMAENKPVGDNACEGAVRKHSQLETKIMSETTGASAAIVRKSKGKFKVVARER